VQSLEAGTGGSSLVDIGVSDLKYASEDELSFGVMSEVERR
jgi:hypothetical protein